MSQRTFAAGGLVVLLLVLAAGLFLTSQKDDPALPNQFEDSPTGFTFRYPEGWSYTIPMLGLLVSAPPQTLSQEEPGPTFTVQRNAPLSVYGSLAEALDLYLRRGPLRPDRQWRKISEIAATTFDEREALVVDLQGKENDASPELRAHVLATLADNSFVYVIVLTAPVEQWEQQEKTLWAMLESLKLLE
jgi:hypothetical protein